MIDQYILTISSTRLICALVSLIICALVWLIFVIVWLIDCKIVWLIDLQNILIDLICRIVWSIDLQNILIDWFSHQFGWFSHQLVLIEFHISLIDWLLFCFWQVPWCRLIRSGAAASTPTISCIIKTTKTTTLMSHCYFLIYFDFFYSVSFRCFLLLVQIKLSLNLKQNSVAASQR